MNYTPLDPHRFTVPKKSNNVAKLLTLLLIPLLVLAAYVIHNKLSTTNNTAYNIVSPIPTVTPKPTGKTAVNHLITPTPLIQIQQGIGGSGQLPLAPDTGLGGTAQ